MDYTLEYSIDQPEQVRASRIMYHRRWSVRVVYGIFVLFILVAAVLGGRSYAAGQERLSAGFVLVIVMAVVGITGMYWSPYWQIRSLRRKNRGAAGPHTYKLHDGGVGMESPGATSTVEWANVNEVFESVEFFFLYMSEGWATLLPKRAIPTEDLPRLRTALRTWVGDRAHLLDSGEAP